MAETILSTEVSTGRDGVRLDLAQTDAPDRVVAALL